MSEPKKGMGFFKKLALAVIVLAVLVVGAGGVLAKVTGNPNY